jgi:hypothetical protein
MEETDTISIAWEIIYRNHTSSTMVVSSNNNCFLFLSLNFNFYLQWESDMSPLETNSFFPMTIS